MSDNKRVIGAASGALGLGAFAAALGTCCIAPWAVSLLGVSGAVALARLAVLQPYALIAAGILLAVAFVWAYRPARACADGTCVTASKRRLRWTVWIAAAIVAVLAVSALMPTLFTPN
ncbi:mercuric transporter MerT family protein [Dokdonella sp.]|uniref:mercuric transporter MerT family protein n=1 Tax=Dokdonella sp. TaxID=2291710 RepID=UPI002F42BE40